MFLASEDLHSELILTLDELKTDAYHIFQNKEMSVHICSSKRIKIYFNPFIATYMQPTYRFSKKKINK